MKKLTTYPLHRDPSRGRTLLRTRNGQALNLIINQVSIFWTYDDHGENDPDLEIWSQTSWGLVSYISRNKAAERLNLPGGTHPVYTSKSLIYHFGTHAKTRTWVFLRDDSRSRGMTFWLFGEKLHVVASRPVDSLDDEAEGEKTFLGKTEFSSDRSVRVNNVCRGIWPIPLPGT